MANTRRYGKKVRKTMRKKNRKSNRNMKGNKRRGGSAPIPQNERIFPIVTSELPYTN